MVVRIVSLFVTLLLSPNLRQGILDTLAVSRVDTLAVSRVDNAGPKWETSREA